MRRTAAVASQDASNPSLPALGLNSLKSVGKQIYLDKNDALVSLDVANLETVGDDLVLYNVKMPTLNLGKLKSVGKNFWLFQSSVQTLDLTSLTTITGDFYVNHGNGLMKLGVPLLRSIGEYAFIVNNTVLPSDCVVKLQMQLTNLGGAFTNMGNGVGTCPP